MRAALWFVLVFLISDSAQSAFDNYNSVLLGDRAAGMGAAFSALTGDASATPFYNPATTVLSPGSAIASSVTLYSKYDTQLGRSEDLVDATQRVNRGFFRSIPSASSAITHFGSFALGLNIVVPDYDTYSGPIRALTGAIALAITGCSRWTKGIPTPFWDRRPFTRLVRSVKEWEIFDRYLDLNDLEGEGYPRVAARALPKLRRLYKGIDLTKVHPA
jgi:hypothetical protein